MYFPNSKRHFLNTHLKFISENSKINLIMKYWLAVCSEENYWLCREHGKWGTIDRYEETMKKVSIGDLVVFHVPKMRCGGIFRVIKGYFRSYERIWSDDVYPHRISINPYLVPNSPVDIRDMFRKYIGKPSQGYFRKSFRELPKDEFDVFKEFLEKGKIKTSESTQVIKESAKPIERCSISLEEDLRRYLAMNPNLIESGFELISEKYKTSIGEIDLLFKDEQGNYVVVETKKDRDSDEVVGQILRYLSVIREEFGNNVRGIIIVNEKDEKLEYALRSLKGLVQLKYYRIRFDIVSEAEFK